MAEEKRPRIDGQQEVFVEAEDIAVGRGFQVCIKLNEEQKRVISDLVGKDVTELRINVDELSDLASVIAN